MYDLGGGTFDLALVGVRGERIEILDHEGDNYLGGKDFDWCIVEQIVLPELARRFDVRSFRRGNKERETFLSLLKAIAEKAKIALSSRAATTLTVESGHLRLLDDSGEEIEADIQISRDAYEIAIEPIVNRTIEVCRRVLDRNRGVSVDSVLLVGGPTLTPYVRHRLSELGLAVVTQANPLTLVAEGAALYAATQPLSKEARPTFAGVSQSTAGNDISIDVRHPAVTDDDESTVGIRVAHPGCAAVELAAENGTWRSGRVPLRDGAVVMRVPTTQRGSNQFIINAFDASGARVAVTPDRFGIHRGLTAAPPPLSRSIGVVIRDEVTGSKSVEWLLKKGTPLPATGTFSFRTTLALEPGGEVETVGVYFVEGESRRPERNRVVGSLEITDRDVPRTVPAGSPVEIRLDVSESRLLRARVLLPITDQLFDVETQMEAEEQTVSSLTQQLLEERERLDRAVSDLSATEVRTLVNDMEAASRLIRAAEGTDPGVRQQALMTLKSIQERLDEVDAKAELPRAIEEARSQDEMTSDVVSAFGNESQQRRLDALSF